MTVNNLGSIPRLDVGSHIRQLRTARKISLRALGEQLGISASALSQIETGRRQPSVARLHQIVSVLEAPLSAVFDTSMTPIIEPSSAIAPMGTAIQRGNEAAELTLDGGIHWLRLAPAPMPGLDLLKVTYPAGAGPAEYMRHNGQETAHVLSGELSFDIAFDHHVIKAGDSISYDSSTPHRVTNRTDRTAEAIWLVVNQAAEHGLHSV
nr:cupin domain-containing protein [Arthrobacter sp. SDTb3-6]